MRIRAFSLIEIIVVIILIGIIFSLVLGSYTGKKKDEKQLSIKNISAHVKKDTKLYIYGDECEKSILILDDNSYEHISNFGYKKEYNVLRGNSSGIFSKVSFETTRIEDKKENVCFKLRFKDGKFFDKFIIATATEYYLFSPLYQDVKVFKSLLDAQEEYISADLYPTSIDDYYHE